MNKEHINEVHKKYYNTQMGRAVRIVQNNKYQDSIYNRGNVDYDAKWVVDNILSKPCSHCGETDWTKIGCNRLDNSKPHTKDNVEPCCFKCNLKLNANDLSKTTYLYDSNKQLLAIFKNLKEASEKTGIPASTIQHARLKNNLTKQGFIWSIIPL